MLLVHHADISSRPILSAVQGVMAVAVARRSPGTAKSAASPTKSPSETSVMVASLPVCETTVILRGLFEDRDGIRRVSLRKEGLFRLQLDNSAPHSGVGQKGCDIECGLG